MQLHTASYFQLQANMTQSCPAASKSLKQTWQLPKTNLAAWVKPYLPSAVGVYKGSQGAFAAPYKLHLANRSQECTPCPAGFEHGRHSPNI